MDTWFDIGASEEFSDGAAVPVHAGGQPLAVFRLGEALFALRDKCSHGNARLSDGYVEDGCVECPLHQGLFDIRSGAPRCAPVTEPVRSFPVRVVAGRVEVEVAGECATPAAACVHGADTGSAAGVPFPAPVAMAANRQVTALIERIEKVGTDVAVLHLRQEAGAALAYAAGQYVDVLLDDGPDRSYRRSYSMATPAGSPKLELHIRHLPGGRFTDQVFSVLRAGQHLVLDGPAGDFYLRPGNAPIILLASGTGFAPLKALMEEAVKQGNTRPMRLYWGGRKAADLYMDALCRQWAGALPWFDYVPVLSEPGDAGDWSGRTGFVHRAVLEDHADLSQHQVYACGAPLMVAAARADCCEQGGLPSSQFFADAFLSEADRKKRA
jgi:NAD(P)H-flavin reductase/nitrite reductase/ring-hydroxylating ferredoxin subunit